MLAPPRGDRPLKVRGAVIDMVSWLAFHRGNLGPNPGDEINANIHSVFLETLFF